MALTIKGLERKFVIGKDNTGISLDDPSEKMSPEEVMDFYSTQYPELTNATINGPKIKDDAQYYYFESTVGTKG